MEVIIKEINYQRPDVFYLYPFFEAHLGAKECSESALKRKVIECANRGKQGIAIGGGDWCDCITSKDNLWGVTVVSDGLERVNRVYSQMRRLN